MEMEKSVLSICQILPGPKIYNDRVPYLLISQIFSWEEEVWLKAAEAQGMTFEMEEASAPIGVYYQGSRDWKIQ